LTPQSVTIFPEVALHINAIVLAAIMASQLPPDVVAAFQQLLQGLASSDNTLRKSAEDRLNDEWVKTRPDMLLLGMVEQIRDGTDPAVSVPAVPVGILLWPYD
jgi:hypothetical protein